MTQLTDPEDGEAANSTKGQLCIQDTATFSTAHLKRERCVLPPVATVDSSPGVSFWSACLLSVTTGNTLALAFGQFLRR